MGLSPPTARPPDQQPELKYVGMRATISAAAMVLALLATSTPAISQVRLRSQGGTATPAGRIREAPLPRSTIIRTDTPEQPRTIHSRAQRRRVPHLFDRRGYIVLWPLGLGWASFGSVPLSLWYDLARPAVAASVPLPDSAPTGGVQLDIEPRRAQVYVDGAYVGVASDFSGYYQHLDLVAGPHLVTIVAPDYEPLTVHVMVTPGRTTTYRSTLTRAYGR